MTNYTSTKKITRNNGIEDIEYTVETCTAICASIGEIERTDALRVTCYASSGEKIEHVVFNWSMDMLADDDDFDSMCDDSDAWDGWHGTLETVELN